MRFEEQKVCRSDGQAIGTRVTTMPDDRQTGQWGFEEYMRAGK